MVRRCCGQVALAELEQIASFPTLRKISLQNVSVTPQQRDAIRRKYPQVQIDVQPDWAMFLSN
jgi:hypothetical protein